MGSQTEYQQKFHKEFIKLYESKPTLWKCGSDEYKNRKEKKRAYQALVAKLREIEPKANVDTVRKKINSLRACYRRVKGKMREALRLGMEPKTQWVYYKYFKFLDAVTDSVEEDEGGWSNCDDSKIDKYEETSLEGDVEEDEADFDIGSRDQQIRLAYDSPSTSPAGLHHESLDNHEEEGVQYRLNIEAQQQFWMDFIKLYESSPVLWKYGCNGYKDRHLKELAYFDLVEKMREVEADADVDMVKRKINSFRATYRRALNKARHAIRVGQKPDYSWVYFDHFAFLHENKNPLEDEDASQEENKFTYFGNNCDDDKEKPDEEHFITMQDLPTKDSSKRSHTSPSPESSPKLVCYDNQDIVHKKQINDEAHIFGLGWACQYRNLSESQKLFAKKAIDDILFEARLGTLHRHSVQINNK